MALSKTKDQRKKSIKKLQTHQCRYDKINYSVQVYFLTEMEQTSGQWSMVISYCEMSNMKREMSKSIIIQSYKHPILRSF